MKIEAWPFLVGRNRNLGYMTVVSPPFLSERGLSILLAEAAGGDESGPDDATYREIRGSEGGDITLIFRVVRAKARDYDLGGDETLKDRGGRSIRLIEGFVVRGRKKTLQITHDDLQMAHNLVKDAYRKFWDAEDTFKEIVSLPIGLPTESHSSGQVQLIREKPLKIPHSPYLPFLNVRLVVVVLVALIVLTLLIPGGIVIYRMITPPAPPDPILSTFCRDLQKANASSYKDAYHQLSGGIQPSLSQSTFVTFFTKHPVASCTYRRNSITDNRPFGATSATAALTIVYRDKVSVSPFTITLREEQNSWKITTNIITQLQRQKT